MQFKYIDWQQGLAQIGQQLNTEFAFAFQNEDKSYSNNMPFVKCRDFFGDVLLAYETQQKQGIYGFKFDPNKQQLTTDKCRILIKFETTESYLAYKKNYDHFKKELRPLSAEIGYGTIHKLEADTAKHIVLVVANPIWQKSVANISWFTFVHKCLSYPNLDHTKSFFDNMLNHTWLVEDWEGNKEHRPTNEQRYLEQTKDTIHLYLKNIKKLTSNLQYSHGYTTQKEVGTVHNSAGFVAVVGRFYSSIGEKLKEMYNAKLTT